MIIIHSNDIDPAQKTLLHFAMSEKIVSGHFLGWLGEAASNGDRNNSAIYIPSQLYNRNLQGNRHVVSYDQRIPFDEAVRERGRTDKWIRLVNGKFVTVPDHRILNSLLADSDSDVLLLTMDPSMLSYRERARITSDGRVAGFRRYYRDSVYLSYIPDEWPHQIFIRYDVADDLDVDGYIPPMFCEFVGRCKSKGLKITSLSVGGTVLDLNTTAGLLTFILKRLNSNRSPDYRLDSIASDNHPEKQRIAGSARIFGNVLIGDNVSIGENAIIIGPAVICNNVSIGREVVVKRSIIGSGVSICRQETLKDSIVTDTGLLPHAPVNTTPERDGFIGSTKLLLYDSPAASNNFYVWPRIGYVRRLKRAADIVMSLVILTLFAPFFPIIAIAIKLNSPGSVFYKARRQGLHSKEFNCLKFRSMSAKADEFQDKLRAINQVDGPQFKMEDDPRVTVVGKFLRDTFIDEIPQFLNVLRGQMSVVGPRPSPEDENLLCPQWRDARLSVRPGITGLWQVCRTRRPGMDFQEWIFYDTKYVREVSLGLDLLIIWKTVKKLIKNFFEKF